MSKTSILGLRSLSAGRLSDDRVEVTVGDLRTLLSIAQEAEKAMNWKAGTPRRDDALSVLESTLTLADFYDLGHCIVPQSCIDHPNYPK